MRNLILSLIILLFCSGTMNSTIAQPDFAYPQTVISDARKHLKQAGDKGPDAALAMLEITVATLAIDNDSVFLLPAEIHNLAEKQSSRAVKSLLLLMEAQTYRAIYNNNRWKYDRTDTPDEPYPADVDSWNGRQFTARINSLAAEAYDLACSEPAPLDDYSKLISAGRIALRYYPTVRDFAAVKALDLLHFSNTAEEDFAINSIIEKEISLCPKGSYSHINWLCRQIDRRHWDQDTLTRQLEALYQQYSNDEAARQLLLKYCDQFSRFDVNAETIELIRRSLSEFPEYFNNNALKNKLKQLLQPWIKFEAPATSIPGHPFEIKVSYGNISNRAGIVVKRGTDSSDRAYTKRNNPGTEVARFVVKAQENVPYSNTATFSFTPDKEVYYYVGSFIDKPENLLSSFQPVLVSSLTPFVINNCTENAVIVADAATGKPIQNVKVNIKNSSTRNPVAPAAAGKTDDEGALRFKVPQRMLKSGSNYLSLTLRDKVFDFGGRLGVYPYRNYIGSGNDEHSALIFTDRALYHHGDSVNWAIAVSRKNRSKHYTGVASDMPVKVSLYNANAEFVADTAVVTDAFGRASGCFALPENMLSGNFSLRAVADNNNIGFSSFEVSDFKLPKFSVKIDSTMRDCPASGWVTIKGRAETYSMMPVAHAGVQAEIKSASRLRWFIPQQTLGYISAETDADGYFTIELSDSLLSQTALNSFVATVNITAADGETRSCQTQFTTGKPLDIVIEGSRLNTADSLALPINVYDASGNQVRPELRWQLTSDNMEIACGSAMGNYRVDWTAIPSGDYTLKVWTADSSLADSRHSEVSLYNTKLGTMSVAEPLFVPERNLEFAHGHAGELLYGAPEDTYIYMTLGADSVLVSVESIYTKAGFHRLKVTLPEGYESGRLTLYAVKEGKLHSYAVNVSEKVNRNIKIEGESFRDRIAPGDVEHWTLRLTSPESGKHLPSAMIATAYNKALEAMAPLNWPRNFDLYRSYTTIITAGYSDRAFIGAPDVLMPEKTRWLQEVNPEMPEFIYPITYYSSLRIRGTRMMKSASVATGAVTEQTEEKLYMSAANDMAAVKENSAEAEMGESVAEDAGEASAAQEPDFAYRPSEVLQALWMPSLVSGNDGVVEISFTVPQANTTWQFNAFAWDERLNSGTFTRDVVSQKPVMVQPNLPRFLRAGDSATVLASVFNNSEEGDSIVTVAEVFDPATGSVLSTSRSAVYVSAKGSAIVSLPVVAPADASIIGYRVRASLGKFTDGEQAAIPVLSADTEVFESQIFSMTANTVEAEVKLPAADKMQTVLEFCSNPAWDVIKALPSLYQGNTSTSYSVARQLFQAAAGKSIVGSDPQIELTLRHAMDNPQDSSLVSQLEKNEELKIATLQQTPWVQAAASQTARMGRLQLLLNPGLTQSSIDRAVKLLGKYRNTDGGFRWGDWSEESSEWATYNVLYTLGRLNAIGAMPQNKELRAIIDPALRYIDGQLKERTTDFSLAWLYTLLPDCKPALKSQKVIAATVQQLLESWRKISVGQKARTAMILKHNGYPKMAGEILASIAQFAKTEKNGAIYFPSVDDIDQYAWVLFAFASLEPESQLVDGVRQWLVMRSQRTDALGSCDPTDLIAAFMRSGSRWTVPATLPEIRLGDRLLQVPEAESMTGHFTMTIDNSGKSGKLTVSRSEPQTPAWGALFSRYTGRTDKIEPHACSQISMDKQLTVLRDGKWQYADKVKLGERVRVVLTINAKDDLQFVTINDDRAAGLEPVDQLPGYVSSAGTIFYRENGNSTTRLFIGWLPRGTYSISYELTANMAGSFISGVATVQSQYAPSVTAHSGGYRLTIE